THDENLKQSLLSLRQTTLSLKENASHIHLIIDTLHKLQKGDTDTIGALDIKSFFKDVVPLLNIEISPQLQEDVEIQSNIEKNLPPIKANPVLLKQVFVNLYKNACEAMINSPQKLIKIEAKIDPTDNNFVLVEFSDTGPGIPEHILPNLFNQGVTTKGQKGSGIGLNQAKTIIEKFGGSISAENKKEGGARFIIRLLISK
ncbi:MAG: HAMP domain-containing histidine kinase, partial [Candidatus Omnitrophica bacterium]|nr:HAMP domain-containing histidine kinase [Candidatus Omnitrophota bacterium]